MKLSQRTEEVLFAVIHNYIDTGDPVGSRTVVRKSNLNLSPATVRNILADLDEMGFLTQPHTSAGRMPTDLGYRFYVNTLMEGQELSNEDNDGIAERYSLCNRKKELSSLLQETSQILSEFSHYIGMVMSPRISNVTYNHMEFIQMQKGEILVILVSQSGIVHSRMISIDLDLSQEVLDELTCCLNDELCGLTLEEVRERIVQKMKADMRLYQELLKKVFIAEDLSLSHASQSWIYLEGASNILDLLEFTDMKRMKEMMQAIEKKSIMVQILDSSMCADGVMVYIGSENPLHALKDCSLVTANYKYKNKVVGTLGVIGPKRMAYSKVIPIVDCTAELLSKFINV
jgi:heat-inducible transcriptional repressor